MVSDKKGVDFAISFFYIPLHRKKKRGKGLEGGGASSWGGGFSKHAGRGGEGKGAQRIIIQCDRKENQLFSLLP